MSRSWLRCGAAPPEPALTVVAVPHAGAGASSFARWPAVLGPGVALARVQLPGREDVVDETPLRRVHDVVARLGPQVARLATTVSPVALYGHSMGALVALELARALAAAGVPPVHLAVSGRRAPHLAPRRAPIHRLDDEAFLAALTGIGAAGAADTAARRRYALRVVRADLEIGEEYAHRAGPALDLPVRAFAGRDDPIVDPDEVRAWSAVTRGPFAAHVLSGGHFFHHEHRAGIAATLRRDWARALPHLDAAPAPTLSGGPAR